MRAIPLFLVLCASAVLSTYSPPSRAQFASQGNLDCNGFSKIQKPLRPYMPCTDYFSPSSEYGTQRGYDNGHYIGHDEPNILFISTAHHSGNDVQWDITLPVEAPLPLTQTFENYIAFWFAMAMCDDKSFPNGPCIPDSDENTPSVAGSAFLELQLYPPGFATAISCDDSHWCAALNIDSLELMSNGQLNPNCTEPVNFAFVQRNGVPPGPPGPDTATSATFLPNAETLLMNPGDHLRVTIHDTPMGLITRIEDLTTGQIGFMIASGSNGFRHTNPNTCKGSNYDFHPEYETARFGNFVAWAALQSNVSFSVEIGHFEALTKPTDADDVVCFKGSGYLIPGCIGADLDFDGQSYLTDWPDGSNKHATSFAIRSVAGNGIGPLSKADDGTYSVPYPIVQLQTDVPASETTCQPNGVGCVVPPRHAQFYPSYALANMDGAPCALVFGNFKGPGYKSFGGDAEYGTSNLPWFFGTNSAGPMANPCTPQTDH